MDMLKAVESDNPMISITLLNVSESERTKPFPYVPRDLIGRMVHSKYDILAIPFLVLSESPYNPARELEFGFHSNICVIEPMTLQIIPANQRPVVHILFDLSELPTDALDKGQLECYREWGNGCFVGIGYCTTQQALETTQHVESSRG